MKTCKFLSGITLLLPKEIYICCSTGLLTMNFLSSCSEKFSISRSFLKDIFVGYIIWVDFFFLPFRTLEVLLHCLLAYTISDKITAIILFLLFSIYLFSSQLSTISGYLYHIGIYILDLSPAIKAFVCYLVIRQVGSSVVPVQPQY